MMEWISILKYNPNHDHLGRFARQAEAATVVGSGAGAKIMESPNTSEGLNLRQAIDKLGSEEQTKAVADANAIAASMGLESRVHSAIGAWADGAENSIVQEITKVNSFEELRAVAAHFGLKHEQKAVLPFQVKKGGPDSLYEFDVPTSDIEKVHKDLGDLGVEFHTLIPNGDSTKVMVFDQGRQMKKTMIKVGDHYDAAIKVWHGQGEFLGSWDSREEGRKEYDKAITAYEKSSGGHDGERRVKGVRADERQAQGLMQILKANPYHDELGRFSTHDRAKFVSVGGKFKSPGKTEIQGKVRDFENRVRHNDFETLYAVDSKGVQLMDLKGASDHVNLPEEWHQNPDTFRSQDIVMSHNHPSGQSFSLADLNVATYFNLKSMRAVGSEWDHEVTRPEGGWPDIYAIQAAHQKHDALTREKFTDEIRRGVRSIASANAEHWHEVWKGVAKDTGIPYSRTRAGRGKVTKEETPSNYTAPAPTALDKDFDTEPYSHLKGLESTDPQILSGGWNLK